VKANEINLPGRGKGSVEPGVFLPERASAQDGNP
jgi:hypothetical protein